MNRRVAIGCLTGAFLSVGTLGFLAGCEAQPAAKPKVVAGLTQEHAKRPFRHNGHFTTVIKLSTGTFGPNLTITVTHTNSAGKKTPWHVYSSQVSTDGTKLLLELVAQDPSKMDKGLTATDGIGTIMVVTTDSAGVQTTTDPNNIPVEPIDTPPCP